MILFVINNTNSLDSFLFLYFNLSLCCLFKCKIVIILQIIGLLITIIAIAVILIVIVTVYQ